VTTNETARANCHFQSLATGLIYPLQSQILKASLHVATRVAEYIFDKNIASGSRPNDFGVLIRTPVYAT
jgi:malate dehydrogenase (oxaloacetate-decarboxylating)(NADP+)